MALRPGEVTEFLSVVDLPAAITEDEAEEAEEDDDDDDEHHTTLEVVCPDGVKAGDTIYLQYGDDEIEVVVPKGISPGDEFEVNLHAGDDEEGDEEELESFGDRIDDALGAAVVDIEAIAGLLQEAKANKVSHPGLVALESKLETLQDKQEKSAAAEPGSPSGSDGELDLDKLLGGGAAALYDRGSGGEQQPQKAKKLQKPQKSPKPMKKKKSPGGSAPSPSLAPAVEKLELSGSDLDRKVEEKMAALEDKLAGRSPQARNRSNSLRDFAKDQLQAISAVVAEDTEVKLAAVEEASQLEAAAEATAKEEKKAAKAKAKAEKEAEKARVAAEKEAAERKRQEEAAAKEAFLQEAMVAKEAQAKLIQEAKAQAAAREEAAAADAAKIASQKQQQKEAAGRGRQQQQQGAQKDQKKKKKGNEKGKKDESAEAGGNGSEHEERSLAGRLQRENEELRREMSKLRAAHEAERAMYNEVTVAYARCDRDTQTHTERETQRHRERETQSDRPSDTDRDRDRDRDTDRETERQSDRERATDRE